MNIDDTLYLLVREHNLAVENLTKEQLVGVIRQAIECGDIQRNILHDGGATKQSVTYVPFRDLSRVQALYSELLYAVGQKHDGESRHETALRYIRQSESQSDSSVSENP